jgi:hypothetical protein
MSPSDVTHSTVDAGAEALDWFPAAAILSENTVIESLGSSVDALFRVRTKCEGSLQKHWVAAAPGKDRRASQVKEVPPRPPTSVPESKATSISLPLPIITALSASGRRKDAAEEKRSTARPLG